MKKLYNFRKKALLLVISAVCLPFFSYAQEQIITGEDELEEMSLSDDILAMGTNNAIYLTFDDGCMTEEDIDEIPHSQKTLTWSNGYGGEDNAVYYSLTLSRFITGDKDYSRLVIHTEKPAEYDTTGDYLFNSRAGVKNFIFPETIDIFDVKVFDDTIYFCGSIDRPKTFTELINTFGEHSLRDTSGFLGWIAVDELFNAKSLSIKYTKTGYILTKLRVFKDIKDNKIRKIVAMGRNKTYGFSTNEFINGHWVLLYHRPSYNDMIFIYNPLGQSKTVQSPKKTDTERFQDIKMIGEDVCIVSLWYDSVNRKYTGTGEEISQKVYFRTVRIYDFKQTASYFYIRWKDILTGQNYDEDITKGIYNARLDYAGWGYGYTNLNANNNTGNYIGFGIDDDMPVTYYDNYENEKISYEYKLLLSFNHYEKRNNQDWYSVVMNWVSPKELIKANNGKYMGAKCSARICEGGYEQKIIDINKLPEKTYKHHWQDYTVQSSEFSSATSEYSVILEGEKKENYIYGIVLDDHTADGEYFWTNTLNTSSDRYDGNYVKGGQRYNFMIVPFRKDGSIAVDMTLNDVNYIQGDETHYYRAVGNVPNANNLKKLDFFQFIKWEQYSTYCYDEKVLFYDEKAYPVTRNYTDNQNNLVTEDVTPEILGISFIETNACSGMGRCESEYLKTTKTAIK
ncbi:MAG: hypothetical protein IJ213_00680 [Bacteroidales bacterium]|nr:hypothetical protein [Bacteroidales bacterium]